VEEHPEIGSPTQCTGFVSEKIGNIPKDIIVNKIDRAKFICKNESFEIKSKKPMLLMDRKKFDLFIANEAEKAGAKFKLSTRFTDIQNDNIITTNGTYKSKLLVGSDGPNSKVAQKLGLKQPEEKLLLVQVLVKSNYDPTVVELWFGSDIAPGSFAWVVPENDEWARVGLMTSEHPNKYFEKFLQERVGKTEIRNRIGDVIRYGLIEKSVGDAALLVGDAAGMVKPFSAGGLVYGQIGAKIAGEACIKALESKDFSEKFLIENYDNVWKEKLTKGIKRGLFFKKIMTKYQDSPFFFKLVKYLGLSKIAGFLDVDFLGKD